MDQNLMGLGWQIASTLVVFTLGGYGLDVWLETNPWFLLTGAALGMISIFYQIFKIASDLNRKEQDVERRTSNVGGHKKR